MGNAHAAPKAANLTARSLKVTLVLDPTEVAIALQPFAAVETRIPLQINVAGRSLRADFAPRAVRRALAALQEHGAESVSVLIQGRLMGDNSIADCGLVAQPKVKAAVAA
jgi:UDP-N-acetylmuramate-alanine ligase